MVSINKSFLYGITFASLTWIISIYLYTHIQTYGNHSTPKAATEVFRNRVDDNYKHDKKKTFMSKDYYKKNQFKTFNSQALVKKLQPKITHSGNTSNVLEQGMLMFSLNFCGKSTK